MGPKTAARLLDLIIESNAIQTIAGFVPPPTAKDHWSTFVETISHLRGKSAGWPGALELVRQWYAPHLERIYDDAMMRQADLVQLAQIASSYPSREQFLTELTLDPPDATSDKAGVPLLDEDYLILSTIHSAKGQEWKSVFVLNCIDGCIPSDLATGTTEEIEEAWPETQPRQPPISRERSPQRLGHCSIAITMEIYSHLMPNMQARRCGKGGCGSQGG